MVSYPVIGNVGLSQKIKLKVSGNATFNPQTYLNTASDIGDRYVA